MTRYGSDLKLSNSVWKVAVCETFENQKLLRDLFLSSVIGRESLLLSLEAGKQI